MLVHTRGGMGLLCDYQVLVHTRGGSTVPLPGVGSYNRGSTVSLPGVGSYKRGYAVPLPGVGSYKKGVYCATTRCWFSFVNL